MKSVDKLSKDIDPQELARWAKTCETMARKHCNDKVSFKVFLYVSGATLMKLGAVNH